MSDKPVTREHQQWLDDQRYEGVCRDLAACLREFAGEPRLQRMQIKAYALELITKIEDEQAHLWRRWD